MHTVKMKILVSKEKTVENNNFSLQGLVELMVRILEKSTNHNLIYAIHNLIKLWIFSLPGRRDWTLTIQGFGSESAFCPNISDTDTSPPNWGALVNKFIKNVKITDTHVFTGKIRILIYPKVLNRIHIVEICIHLL